MALKKLYLLKTLIFEFDGFFWICHTVLIFGSQGNRESSRKGWPMAPGSAEGNFGGPGDRTRRGVSLRVKARRRSEAKAQA